MGKANVMVVEDEPYTRNCLQLILAEAGFASIPASSGDEALARLESSIAEKHPIDVLVTDITMPHMSGIELIDELHRRKIDIPILAITAFPENHAKLKNTRIVACLEKPFDRESFMANLSKAISLRKSQHNSNLEESSGHPTSCQMPESSSQVCTPQRQHRILLVEDDESIRCDIASLLKSEGYEVIEAKSGQDAEGMLRSEHTEKNPFDLIIADIRRPLIMGMGIVKKLREHVIKLPGLVINAFPVETIPNNNADKCANETFDKKLFAQCVKRFFDDDSQIRSNHGQIVHIPWQFFQRDQREGGLQ